nr:MAG TPA: hypothetical protein [Caudoviricetes sp.]
MCIYKGQKVAGPFGPVIFSLLSRGDSQNDLSARRGCQR